MVERQGEGVGRRLVVFARSVALLGALCVGVPWLLVLAARERFGGGAPFHGVPGPADWDAGRIRSALTDRLTDQTVADIVIRAALTVAWVAVIVLVLTVIAEVVHMARHDGLALPDVRGLGLTQRTARVIAAGLLVVVPLVTSPSAAVARSSTPLVPAGPVAADVAADTAESAGWTTGDTVSSSSSPDADAEVDVPAPRVDGARAYVVQAGDSIFGIAERLAGPDTARVASFAEQLLELNMGREMPDGRRFGNAAFIDVGWVLELPAVPAAPVVDAPSDRHVVEPGESLWSIAEDELGDPTRWPEVYDANAGRTFDDGRTLHDPDLIQPGWVLQVPGGADDDGDDAGVASPAPAEEEIVQSEGGEGPAPERVADDVPPARAVVDDPAVGATPRPPGHLAEAQRTDHAPDGGIPGDADRPEGGAAAAVTAATPASPIDDQVDDQVDGPEVARRDNVWSGDGRPPAATDRSDRSPDAAESGAPSLLHLGGAAMLSAGALTLLAVRRRRRLRQAPPRSVLPAPGDRAAATERVLRSIDAGERFARVERAIRSAAPALVASGRRVELVLAGADGALELRASGAAELPSPWVGAGATWRLSPQTPSELLAVPSSAGMPSPTLVQLGTDEHGRDVYVDLEALEAIEVGGPGVHADAIVAAVAATLAGSTLAEVTTLVGLGVADDAFLGHRLYRPVRDAQRAFETAAEAIGSTAAMTRSTFELRATSVADEAWEPAVVLVGAAAGTITPPASRTGLAVVSAAPVHGPSSRLAPDGDAWQLLPAGVRLTPVGLTPDDVRAVAELVAVPAARSVLDRAPLDDDHTIVPGAVDPDAMTVPSAVAVLDVPDPSEAGEAAEPDHRLDDDAAETGAPPASATPPSSVRNVDHDLLVRLLGPVDVTAADGRSVEFERSKTRELVAWLVTHRDRSTRSSARAALWELDVRDATFSNVVSEARRALARLVEPPEGQEWVGRTMTDALPVHERVVSDADLLRDALASARVQPPAQAIATLRPAVELIAGLPFEGTAYLWPDSEGITSDLVLLSTSATAELAAHCLSIGDVDGVFAATGRGLRVLPAHEELIGLRMEAHARTGDHAGVRQEWEAYERVINADPWSDGEPAPKLVELRRRLLNPNR